MRRGLHAFMLAIEFLTIIRWRRDVTVDGPSLGASLGWFPVVGLLIGGLLALVAWIASMLLPPPVVAAIVVATMALVTGALHLDGLADSADGIFGGHTPEQRLAIMRDSRIGTFGVVAVVLALLLTYASLVTMTGWARTQALLLAPALGRLAMVAAVASFPPARSEGLGRLYRGRVGRDPVLWAVITGNLVAFTLAGVLAVLAVLATACCALVVGSFSARRLGGLTGDVYGAIGVLTEVVLFVGAAGIEERGWLYSPWR